MTEEDLRNGEALVRFAANVGVIRTASGHEHRAAGPPILYAMNENKSSSMRHECLRVTTTRIERARYSRAISSAGAIVRGGALTSP